MADKWIYVTPIDIKNGVTGNATECPIARAVKRRLNSDDVWVYPGNIYADNVRYVTPYHVRKFMIDFDYYRLSVDPIRFKLPTGVELAR